MLNMNRMNPIVHTMLAVPLIDEPVEDGSYAEYEAES